MTGYEWLVFFHVLAAIVWVGGAAITQVMALRIIRSGDDRQVAGFAQTIEWIGFRVYVPASLLVVVVGFVMVGQSEAWSLGQTWIWLSLVFYGVSFLMGLLFLGPETGRLGALLQESGAGDPEYKRRLVRILNVSRGELLLLFGVVFLMVTKIGA